MPLEARRPRFGALRLVVLSAAILSAACTTGEGEGWVRSDRLYIEECWNGPFDLDPDFFAANPFQGEQVFIRVQRGDNIEEFSDGLFVLVDDLPLVRGQGAAPQRIGLRPGVAPPGFPVVPTPDPPHVSMTLYLHDTCHVQNGAVYAIDGEITFQSLFSGDINESDADDRLTEASFTATFADPRKVNYDGTFPEGVTSEVSGYFRFFFQRGQPAQPFP